MPALLAISLAAQRAFAAPPAILRAATVIGTNAAQFRHVFPAFVPLTHILVSARCRAGCGCKEGREPTTCRERTPRRRHFSPATVIGTNAARIRHALFSLHSCRSLTALSFC